MKPIVLVDMDETLNDMLPAFKKIAYEKGYMRNPYVEIKTWGLEDYLDASSFSKEQRIAMVDEIFCMDGFWYNLPLKPLARNTIEIFSDKFDFYIATIPWWNSKTCLEEKKEWVRQVLPDFPLNKLLFCYPKHLINADYMIDDNPRILTEFPRKTIAMDYAYNRDIKANYRVRNWEEVFTLLYNIA